MEVVITGVYVYAHDAQSFATTGLAGDLQPIKCYFEEEKNGKSQLTMTLPYDSIGKWQQVKVGRYIKAKVPVRTPPDIDDNAYAQVVESYRVVEAPAVATYSLRSVARAVNPDLRENRVPLFFNSQARDYAQPSALLGVGDTVYKKKKSYKPALTPEEKEQEEEVYAPGKGSGVVAPENLEYIEEVTIPPALNGLEAAAGAVRLEYQLFIVTDVVQGEKNVEITAQHVFYELLNNYTTFKTENEISGAAACVGVFKSMVSPEKRFSILSNCTETVKGLDYNQQSVAQALLDPEEGICARFDAAILRDNYYVYVIQGAGGDRGFVAEYGNNLLGVEYSENIEETYTRIVPWGLDKEGNPVYMDGTVYVDSPYIDDYPAPRVLLLDCSDTAVESEDKENPMTLEQVKAELKRRADEELAAEIDKPRVSMVVDFLSLGDTEEFKQYRDLDKVYMLDHIAVKHKKRGYNFSAEVVGIYFNVNTEKLEEVTIGSLQKGSNKRKIATWQVPTIDGSNIRLQSITAGAIGPGAILESAIRNGVITVDKLAANSVTADKIAAGAVTAGKIDAQAVDAENLKAGAVTADKIESKTITADKLQTGLITAESGLIGEGAIGSAQIADGSITDAKIVELTANKINAGTLSVERLVVVGNEKSIVYAVNEANGTPQLSQTTLDGGSLTQRSITADRIVAEAITSDEIAANAVTANKILSGAVTTEKLDALSVTADKLAAESVTASKIAADVGRTLDLSSNESVKASVVAGVENSAMTLTKDEFTLAFDGKHVMEVDEDSAVFDVDTLTATGQIIGNVVNTQAATTITVPSGSSIQSAIDNLGKYLLGNVTIYVSGQHTENLKIQGFSGPGIFSLRFNSGAVLSGSIEILSCSSVQIHGPSQTECCILSSADNCINVRSVPYFSMYRVYMMGTGAGFGVMADFCMAHLAECNFAGFACGVEGRYNAQIGLYNCIGGGDGDKALSTYAAWAHAGSMVSVYGDTRPVGALYDSSGWGLMRDAGAAPTPASGAEPTVQTTYTLKPSGSRGAVYATRDGSGNYVHAWGYYTNPYQGKNSGAGGYMFGIWLFDGMNDLQSALRGKTIESATLTLKRVNAYGVDGKKARIYSHSLDNVAITDNPNEIFTDTGLEVTLDRGKSASVTLPESILEGIKNGTVRGFGLSSQKYNDLMQLDGTVCDIAVVYS